MFDTFEVGKVYKFGYNGKERKIIVSNVQIGGVTGFDFSCDGFRSFTIQKIEGKVEELASV